MTRFAVDAPIVLRLLDEHREVAAAHSLVGAGGLRSTAMALLFRDVRSGRRSEREGRELLEAIAGVKIRLLGDRVSRATAWTFADRLGWEDTAAAEPLAVCALQADALITDDPQLVEAAGTLGLTLADIGDVSA